MLTLYGSASYLRIWQCTNVDQGRFANNGNDLSRSTPIRHDPAPAKGVRRALGKQPAVVGSKLALMPEAATRGHLTDPRRSIDRFQQPTSHSVQSPALGEFTRRNAVTLLERVLQGSFADLTDTAQDPEFDRWHLLAAEVLNHMIQGTITLALQPPAGVVTPTGEQYEPFGQDTRIRGLLITRG